VDDILLVTNDKGILYKVKQFYQRTLIRRMWERHLTS